MIQVFAINFKEFPIVGKNIIKATQLFLFYREDLHDEMLQPISIPQRKGRIIEMEKNRRVRRFGHFSKFVNKVQVLGLDLPRGSNDNKIIRIKAGPACHNKELHK